MDTQIKVASVVTRTDGHVLLIKEKLPKNNTALWNIIKGTYHGNETVFEAAARECKEEASVDVTLTGFLGVYVSEEDENVRIQFTFIAQPTSESNTAHIPDKTTQDMFNEAISEIRWCSKEEVQALPPEAFVSQRAYTILQNWMQGTHYPLESVMHIEA